MWSVGHFVNDVNTHHRAIMDKVNIHRRVHTMEVVVPMVVDILIVAMVQVVSTVRIMARVECMVVPMVNNIIHMDRISTTRTVVSGLKFVFCPYMTRFYRPRIWLIRL